MDLLPVTQTTFMIVNLIREVHLPVVHRDVVVDSLRPQDFDLSTYIQWMLAIQIGDGLQLGSKIREILGTAQRK